MWGIEAGQGTKNLHITAIGYRQHSDQREIIGKISMINW